MSIDQNSVKEGVVINGYGFTSSSGPEQDSGAPKAKGAEEEWYVYKEDTNKLKPSVALPENKEELRKALANGTTISGVPTEVIRKIASDCGNNPKKTFDFTLATYQSIEAGQVIPAIKMTFSLGAVSAANNIIKGTLTGTPTIEVFNNEGVNAYSINIDVATLTVTS